jgi:hypothetical protein
MTKKEATDDILARLVDPMEKHGFSLLKSRLRFQGPASDFRALFDVAVHDVVAGSEFRPQVGIRAEEVENIVNRAAQTASATARHSATLGEYVGVVYGEPTRWRAAVKTEDQLDGAVALMLEALTQRAVPFYEKYSNLRAIDAHVNGNPNAPALLCPADLRRAEAGVVVARLLGRVDLAELIDAHRRQLKHLYRRDVPDFEDFLTRLESEPAFLK